MRLVPFALVLVACKGAPAPVATPTPEPAAVSSGPVLARLQAGDAACYLILKGPDGTEIWHEGSFDLCPGAPSDASALVGQPVVLEIGRQKIMAGSCEGDPECTETEEIDFVTSVKAGP